MVLTSRQLEKGSERYYSYMRRLSKYMRTTMRPIAYSVLHKLLRVVGLMILLCYIMLYGTRSAHASGLELVEAPNTLGFTSSGNPISSGMILGNTIKANDININFCNRDSAGNYGPYLQRQVKKGETFPLCTLISNNSDRPAYLTLHYIRGRIESGDISCLDEKGAIESLLEDKRYILVPAHGFGKVTKDMIIQEDTIGCVNFGIINATVDKVGGIKPMVRKFYVYKFKVAQGGNPAPITIDALTEKGVSKKLILRTMPHELFYKITNNDLKKKDVRVTAKVQGLGYTEKQIKNISIVADTNEILQWKMERLPWWTIMGLYTVTLQDNASNTTHSIIYLNSIGIYLIITMILLIILAKLSVKKRNKHQPLANKKKGKPHSS